MNCCLLLMNMAHFISLVVGDEYKEINMKKVFLMIVALFLVAGIANAGVNINSATQSELEMLQGIGPSKARAIIQYREQNGPFNSINDLKKVKGIGSSTIKQLGNSITVGGSIGAEGKSGVFATLDRSYCQHRGQC